jgi:hypothetical protein
MTASPLPRWRLALALAILIVAAIALTALSETRRHSGDEYVLEIEPYDPRDMFFGHYAVIRFEQEIAEFPEAWCTGTESCSEITIPEGAEALVSFEDRRIKVTGYLEAGHKHAGPENAVPIPAGLSQSSFRLADRLFTLPDRYYADQVTSLALENAIRDMQQHGDKPSPIYAIISYKSPQDIRLNGLVIEGREYRDRLWAKPAIKTAFQSAPKG